MKKTKQHGERRLQCHLKKKKCRPLLHRTVYFVIGSRHVKCSFYMDKHSAPVTALCPLVTSLMLVLKEALRKLLEVLNTEILAEMLLNSGGRRA